jgi:hypothetical protein
MAALWWLMLALQTRSRVAGLGLLLLACTVWAYFQPCSGKRWFLAQWRYYAIYRRDWIPAMKLSGLAHGELMPRLRRVEIDGVMDVVHVAMIPGQVAERWHQQREYLAQVFGARFCTIFAVGDRSPVLLLEFAVRPGPAAPDDGAW